MNLTMGVKNEYSGIMPITIFIQCFDKTQNN